ncbi:histidine phosphatase family protein [Nakamurella sp. A5-74]|uniref:Histidine phosphatase family protein n=1 Tax=Nakamurella sp. A5-74 TaxID=3158264 RepID=A0AAU8DWP5_9ACTN
MVTHPEATHHVDRVVGGWFDSELTARGGTQADAIARSLAARIPTGASVEVRSSALVRARTTADIIAGRLGVEVRSDSDLREKSCGADTAGRQRSPCHPCDGLGCQSSGMQP